VPNEAGVLCRFKVAMYHIQARHRTTKITCKYTTRYFKYFPIWN